MGGNNVEPSVEQSWLSCAEFNIAIKVKVALEQTMKDQRRSRVIALFSLISALDGGRWLTSSPCRFIPAKETRCPLCKRWDKSQGRSGRVPENFVPTGFRSQDWPAHSQSLYRLSYRGPLT